MNSQNLSHENPFWKNLHILKIWIICLLGSSCSKDITLNLPTYESKLVIEFYLENNKPLKCLLQESVPYTDTSQLKLVNSALIVLKYSGISDTLLNIFYRDSKFEKIYNYYNPKLMNLRPGIDYELYVKDSQGREMSAQTRVNTLVGIDSFIYNYNSINNAAVGLVFNDNSSEKNFYRIVAFKDSIVVKEERTWDITLTDNVFNGNQFSFYTGYTYNRGDTITGRLYHLTADHYNFASSVNNSQSSNGNPFGQPANIVSNVSGGHGIFTVITYDEKKVILQ